MPDVNPVYDKSDISLEREVVYRDSITSIQDVVETVRRWGIVVFPSYIKKDRLAKLNIEFDNLLVNRAKLGFTTDEYENITNIRLKQDELDSTTFSYIASFFNESFMSDVSQVYYGADNYRLNGEIFVSELTETQSKQTKPPFALHFDKRNVLKFFLYLTDTDERNGAMRALPGSNVRNRAAREDAMHRTALKDIENVLPEPLVPSMPICGPAGTLFIFDTDMCHGASFVKPGFTRRSMRGHTHSHEMLQAMDAEI